MRLLKIEADGELRLVGPTYDCNLPCYAILSHTWGKNEDEVTLQDLQNGTGKDKPGYSKISFCKEQAQKDNLQYFWIDTCCIDQTNPAELSYAINSMWLWYRRSRYCYALLSDVDYSDQKSHELPYTDLLSSRWFRRGWTLQELIAPRSLSFFDKAGLFLGDRDDVDQYIAEHTKIPATALGQYSLQEYEIDERFLWARGRETQRPEDRAYSLLGIFGVSMPLLYGEGILNALCRLRREIHQQEVERASGNDIVTKAEYILQLISTPSENTTNIASSHLSGSQETNNEPPTAIRNETAPLKGTRRDSSPGRTVGSGWGNLSDDDRFTFCDQCGAGSIGAALHDVCPVCGVGLW